MKKIVLVCYFTFVATFILFAQNCQFEESVTEEMFRGRYKVTGMTYGNPYTMFNKRKDGWRLDSTLVKIKNLIKNGIDSAGQANNDYSKIYSELYKFDTTTNQPMPCNEGEDCGHPMWTKNQAIIYIIGLRYSRTNGRDTFTQMNEHDRKQFGARAFDGLKNLNPHVISCWGGGDCGKVHLKAYGLMQYLQAYDLLKAGGYILPFDQDRNGLDCSPRSKLRELSRNLYIQSEDILNSFQGWKKNHGIICGSALCMAAIVLNDAGVETSYAQFFLGWLWGEGTNWPRPNYSPQNWYDRGYGTPTGYNIFDGEDGLRDCFFIGDHAMVPDVPQTNSDGTAGYAEGPVYFNYVLKAFLPLVRARDNFVTKDKSFLGPNFSSYTNIFKWYMKILNLDGSLPTYDNSSTGEGNLLGILGEPEYPGNANFVIGSASNVDLRGDYLLAMGGGEIIHESIYDNTLSGNIVLKNTNNSAEHTFHMLAEKGVAIDIAATRFDGTHEDDDLGSFMIYAGDAGKSAIPLAIDAPYFGWKQEEYTNKYWMHNTIEIDDGNPEKDRVYKNPQYTLINDGKVSNIQSFNLTFDFKNEDHTLFGSAITRNVNAINNTDNFYYFINDYVNVDGIDDEDGTFQYIKLNINGNGNNEKYDKHGDPTFFEATNGDILYRWTYPCDDHKWSLTAHVSALNNNVSGKSFWKDEYTDYAYPFLIWSNTEKSTRGSGISGDYHTRLRIHQPVSKTIFQSFLYPQKCDWPLPKVTKEETADFVNTKIRFINSVNTDSITARMGKIGPPNSYINDTASHFHFARWQGGIADTVTNPFNLPTQSNIKLYLNAQKAFIKHNTYAKNIQGYKYCPASYINIKYASIDNGSYLKFNDTFLIKSPILMNAYLGFQSRYSYIANITPLAINTTADSIEIYLADLGRGKDMVALSVGT